MGLGLMLLFVSGMYLRTKDPKWRRLSFFWVKIYGIVFAMGVATGVVMEFEFGMNWADYSRFVGNIFGSLLAAEGVFAFFLEGGFLGLMLFGGNRLGPKMWFMASLMVVFGAHFSALWIVMANSWMQTPGRLRASRTCPRPTRAVMTDFWEVVFTPSFMPRIMHVFFASWTAGAAFVASVERLVHPQEARVRRPGQGGPRDRPAASSSSSRSPTPSSSALSRPATWPRTSPASWPPWKASGRPRRTPRPSPSAGSTRAPAPPPAWPSPAC